MPRGWEWDETLYAGAGRSLRGRAVRLPGRHRRRARRAAAGAGGAAARRRLRAAGFDGPQSVTVPSDGVLERTEDQVVAAVFSVSGSVPHLFGERRGQFEVDLRSLLRRHSSSGRFSERARDVTLQLWRPAERAT